MDCDPDGGYTTDAFFVEGRRKVRVDGKGMDWRQTTSRLCEQRGNDMRYELTIKMLVESPHSKERVARQTESVCEFGTVREAIAEGLKLGPCPRLLSVDVNRLSGSLAARA